MIRHWLDGRVAPRLSAWFYLASILTSGIATAAVLALVLLRFLSGSALAAMGNACGGIFAFSHGFLAASRLNYLLAALFTVIVLLQLAFLLGGGTRLFRVSHRQKRRCRQDARHCAALGGITGKPWADRICMTASSLPEAATVGLLRPRIVISRGMIDSLPAAGLSAVVEHEDAHRCGYDNLIVATAKSVSLTLFYLPGPRMALRRLRSSLEIAADRRAATAIGSPLAVASALAGIARANRPGGTDQLAVAVTGSGDLTGRLQELVQDGKPPRGSWRRLMPLAGLTAVALAIFSLSSFSVASADQRGAFICFTEHQQGAGPDGICTLDHQQHANN